MRKAVAFTLVSISLALLAAHLYRGGYWPLALGALAAISLLLLRRPWVQRLLQGLLLIGTLEWLRTATRIAEARIDQGKPYLRMALILGAVALLTAASAWLLQHPALRRHFVLQRG